MDLQNNNLPPHQPSEGWESSMRRAFHKTLGKLFTKKAIEEVADEYIVATRSLLSNTIATARREESERWNNAVCSVVDAETLDKIREVIWKQEQLLLTQKKG